MPVVMTRYAFYDEASVPLRKVNLYVLLEQTWQCFALVLLACGVQNTPVMIGFEEHSVERQISGFLCSFGLWLLSGHS
jgi:hypothetical protein